MPSYYDSFFRARLAYINGGNEANIKSCLFSYIITSAFDGGAVCIEGFQITNVNFTDNSFYKCSISSTEGSINHGGAIYFKSKYPEASFTCDRNMFTGCSARYGYIISLNMENNNKISIKDVNSVSSIHFYKGDNLIETYGDKDNKIVMNNLNASLTYSIKTAILYSDCLVDITYCTFRDIIGWYCFELYNDAKIKYVNMIYELNRECIFSKSVFYVAENAKLEISNISYSSSNLESKTNICNKEYTLIDDPTLPEPTKFVLDYEKFTYKYPKEIKNEKFTGREYKTMEFVSEKLMIDNCDFYDIYSPNENGGALFLYFTCFSLKITDSSFVNCTCDGTGGAIMINDNLQYFDFDKIYAVSCQSSIGQFLNFECYNERRYNYPLQTNATMKYLTVTKCTDSEVFDCADTISFLSRNTVMHYTNSNSSSNHLDTGYPIITSTCLGYKFTFCHFENSSTNSNYAIRMRRKYHYEEKNRITNIRFCNFIDISYNDMNEDGCLVRFQWDFLLSEFLISHDCFINIGNSPDSFKFVKFSSLGADSFKINQCASNKKMLIFANSYIEIDTNGSQPLDLSSDLSHSVFMTAESQKLNSLQLTLICSFSSLAFIIIVFVVFFVIFKKRENRIEENKKLEKNVSVEFG